MIEYELVTRSSDLPKIAEEIAQAGVVGFDTETTSLTPFTGDVRLASVNTGKGVYVIDVFQTQSLGPVLTALAETDAAVVGANLKFDVRFLHQKYGFEPKKLFDVYRASNILYNGKNFKHDLYSIYSRELMIGPEAKDLGGSNWAGALDREQLDYAAEDVVHLPKIREALIPKLKKQGLVRIAQIEFEAIMPEAAIELNGLWLDQDRWRALAKENEAKARLLRAQLLRELPHPGNQMALPGFDPDFNLDSPIQLLASLRKLGMKIEDTKEITLAMLVAKYPVLKTLMDYREFSKLSSTFGEEWLRWVRPETKRIHTEFYPYTGAGRYASSSPNLQQCPRDKRFRSCFRAEAGNRIVGKDYSQIELRVSAEMALDERLIGVYVRGEDAHAQTASLVAQVDIKSVTKLQRQMAKAVNFGLVFGMRAPKLVLYAQANYGVSMTLEDAEKFRERYFEAYDGIRRWHDAIFSEDNRKKGIVHTIAGRLRYLGLDAYNEHANTRVQGTAADGLKASLAIVYRKLKKYGKDARMIHMVHDEILTECRDDADLVSAVDKDLNDGMVEGMQPMLKRVPVIAEGSSGYSWADKG